MNHPRTKDLQSEVMMCDECPRFLTLTGQPGSGKSTVAKALIAEQPLVWYGLPLMMFRGQSYTTRPPRSGDVPGEYCHVSDEVFDRMLADGEFIWNFPHGDYRVATREEDIAQALAAPYMSIMTLVPDAVWMLQDRVGERQILPFFILSVLADNIERMVNRGDSRDKAQGRALPCAYWRAGILETHGVRVHEIPNPNEDKPAALATSLIRATLLDCHNQVEKGTWSP